MKEGHCLGDQVLNFANARLETEISFAPLNWNDSSACSPGVGISLVPAMAARKKRAGLPEYRSLVSPKPERKIVAIWPKQRPLSRAANELLKQIIANSKEL
jgi:LysR family hydrogen peroxide-inducible transcriptional activator